MTADFRNGCDSATAPATAPAGNPYEVFFAGTGSTHRLDAAWAKVSALLATGTFTLQEVVQRTGVGRRVAKGLLHHGRQAGQVRSVKCRRHVEAAPNVTLVRTMHGYTLAGKR